MKAPPVTEAEQLVRDLATAKALGDVTANGVAYEWRLSMWNGSRFTLLREPHHTDADIDTARALLNEKFEVVSINVLEIEDATERNDLSPSP